MIRAVLFDLDGTLADTAQDLASALNRLRAEHRMAPLAPELTRALASSGARGLLKVGFDLDPNDERYPPMRDRFLGLYDGDDLRDVQGARAAGMPVIAAGWGYLGVEGDPASWGADAVLAHPAEVLGFLD